ncbi:MAG: hypothetical protein AAF447_16005 [Myxococcota bacterium]
MKGRRRRAALALGLGLALALGLWLWLWPAAQSPRARGAGDAALPAAVPDGADAGHGAHVAARPEQPRSAAGNDARARPPDEPEPAAGAAQVPDLGLRTSGAGLVGIPAVVPAPVPEATPDVVPEAAAEGEGGLRNRGGPALAAVAAQLNGELMPLVDECIAMARERQPSLTGNVALELDIVPSGPGRALVTAVRPQEGHDVDDPELFFCLRESALSLEGLEEPRSVSLTIPLGPARAEPEDPARARSRKVGSLAPPGRRAAKSGRVKHRRARGIPWPEEAKDHE